MVRRLDRVHDKIPDIAHYMRTVTHKSVHKTLDEAFELARTSLINEPKQKSSIVQEKPKVIVRKTEARTSLYEELKQSGGQKSLKPSTRTHTAKPSRKEEEVGGVCEYLKKYIFASRDSKSKPHDKFRDSKPGCSKDKQTNSETLQVSPVPACLPIGKMATV